MGYTRGMERAYGSGSVYQRADGRWMAVYSQMEGGARKKKTFSAKDRETAELRLDNWMREQGIEPRQRIARRRAGHMAHARAKATHAREDWEGLLASAGGRCHYCERGTDPWMMTKDHALPVSRGGSDGIDNLRAACWDCNYNKRNMSEDEFLWWANQCGLFERERRWVRRVSGDYAHSHAPSLSFHPLGDGRVACGCCGKSVCVTRQGAARVHRRSPGVVCPNSGRLVDLFMGRVINV